MSWRPVLEGADAQRATDVAQRIGSRLAGEQRADGPGIADRSGSAALLCAQLDRAFPDQGWDAAGHAQLAASAQLLEQDAAGLGLFQGAAGVGFAAAALAGGRPRYERLLAEVDAVIVGGAEATCARLADAAGLPAHAWDLISGLTGVGAYLLGRPDAGAALEQVLATLVALSADADGRPRWWTPHDALQEDMRAEFPDGNVNCGVAHGVAGPLALWALAARAGIEVEGQAEATARVGAWLAAQAHDGPWGPLWPAAVAAAADPPVPFVDVRPGWCYGNAGWGAPWPWPAGARRARRRCGPACAARSRRRRWTSRSCATARPGSPTWACAWPPTAATRRSPRCRAGCASSSSTAPTRSATTPAS